jgi:hypothetical protein
MWFLDRQQPNNGGAAMAFMELYCAFTREVATICGGGTAVKGTLPFGEGVGRLCHFFMQDAAASDHLLANTSASTVFHIEFADFSHSFSRYTR